MVFEFWSRFQFATWLIFLHVAYYSIAFRIEQLTKFLQTKDDCNENDIEYDGEDQGRSDQNEIIVSRLNRSNKR